MRSRALGIEGSPDTSDIGRAAIRALYDEVALYPKPGLVSPVDNGAHADMDMRTFLRSLSALRPYFREIAAAGADGAGFADLQPLGIAAERRMMAATGGVNTHRGAIFTLGLLAAAAGYHRSRGLPPDGLGGTIVRRWGPALAAARPDDRSHGRQAVVRYAARGAREEAAEGFPALFAIALPVYRATREATGSPGLAGLQTLFALMAALDDTNLLHRGGAEGLAFVQAGARDFLGRGGVLAPGWQAGALALHQACIARHLSPGGSADILAAAIFVDRLARTLV